MIKETENISNISIGWFAEQKKQPIVVAIDGNEKHTFHGVDWVQIDHLESSSYDFLGRCILNSDAGSKA